MAPDAEGATYYRLEVVARLSGLSPSCVRRLERVGLIRPARQIGADALYGEREVIRLRRIRRLTRHLGVNLAGVAIILRLTEELAALRKAQEVAGNSTRDQREEGAVH